MSFDMLSEAFSLSISLDVKSKGTQSANFYMRLKVFSLIPSPQSVFTLSARLEMLLCFRLQRPGLCELILLFKVVHGAAPTFECFSNSVDENILNDPGGFFLEPVPVTPGSDFIISDTSIT
jgi:hypothetical protein